MPPEFVNESGSAPRRASLWWFRILPALDALIFSAVAVHVLRLWARVNFPQPQWIRLELDREEERVGWLAAALIGHVGLAWAAHIRGQSRALRPSSKTPGRGLLILAVAALTVAHAVSWLVPRAAGVMTVADVEPLLVERLSSTWGGVPALAAVHLVGTALACLYIGRVSQDHIELLSGSRPGQQWLRRAAGWACFAVFLFGAMGVIQRATGLPGLFTQ